MLTIDSDGAELCNASQIIVAACHNLVLPDGQSDTAAVFCALTEWCDWENGQSVAGDCPEAVQLYEAAVAFLCRWAGIDNRSGLKHWLQTRKGANHA